MTRSHQRIPDVSPAEHDVLDALWRLKRASVRDVHDAIVARTGWAYTTTKTVMDRMVAKGLAQRDSVAGTFVYAPLISKPQGLVRFVRYFAERVLERDLGVVLPLFKDSHKLTDAELAELTLLIEADDAGKGGRR